MGNGTGSTATSDAMVVLKNGNTGFGTSTPDNSAKLDVSSTTQGFLPPRMTETQRIDISSPVAGLVVWCTNCGPSGELQVNNGSIWTNMIGGTAAAGPAIGNYYRGGIVFYLDGLGGGLIAAPTEVSTGAQWGCYGTSISGADGTAVGTGNQNTIDIEAGCTTTGTAADICANLTLNGYTDWFLPSSDELNRMYLNIGQGNGLGLGNIGGFADAPYWSSTEYGASSAWKLYFFNGNASNYTKYNTNYVRAVRAF